MTHTSSATGCKDVLFGSIHMIVCDAIDRLTMILLHTATGKEHMSATCHPEDQDQVQGLEPCPSSMDPGTSSNMVAKALQSDHRDMHRSALQMTSGSPPRVSSLVLR